MRRQAPPPSLLPRLLAITICALVLAASTAPSGSAVAAAAPARPPREHEEFAPADTHHSAQSSSRHRVRPWTDQQQQHDDVAAWLSAASALTKGAAANDADADEPTYEFWQLTDAHLDMHYVPGTATNATCHGRPLATALEAYTPTKSPIAGLYGAPLTQCDAPTTLLDRTLAFVKRTTTKWGRGGVEFVVWTGDGVRHPTDRSMPLSYAEVVGVHRYLASQVRGMVPVEVPVIPTIGNNDVFPHNALAPSSKLLHALSHIWAPFIPLDQVESFKAYGAFAVSVRAPEPDALGLSVVSINTMWFYPGNPYAAECTGGNTVVGDVHLAWLEKVLREAKEERRQVYVIGHVPPAREHWYRRCLARYALVVGRYSDVVVAQLFGHVNLDHFVLVGAEAAPANAALIPMRHTDDEHPVKHAATVRRHFTQHLLSATTALHRDQTGPIPTATPNLTVALVSPSIIPNYLPSVRRYVATLRSGSHVLSDYTQYLWNISDASTWTTEQDFVVEYTARDAYGLTQLDASEYVRLAWALMGRTAVGGGEEDKDLEAVRDRFWRYFAVSTGVSEF
ncbi:Endopolyphosphatase [Allomyces javanicus]|nr:Endopolyphosphatase [Allomyces javanicus]